MKYKLILCLMLFQVAFCVAQRLPVLTYRLVAGDSIKKTKKINHYLGIQANQLLNQLVNFGGNTPLVSNPYLLIYSFNSMSTGWGLNTGLGYNLSTIDASDAATQRTSTFDDFSMRIGVEKKSFLSKKWLVSWGFDIVWTKQEDDTKSSFQSQFNSNSTDRNSSTTYFGFGPRCSLNFLITERIILGTEATYYYRSVSNTQKVTNSDSQTFIDPNTQQSTTIVNTSSSGTSQRSSDFKLGGPVALFLIVKF